MKFHLIYLVPFLFEKKCLQIGFLVFSPISSSKKKSSSFRRPIFEDLKEVEEELEALKTEIE
jgi:hypothetical protein